MKKILPLGAFLLCAILFQTCECEEHIPEIPEILQTGGTVDLIDNEPGLIDTLQLCYAEFKAHLEYIYLFDGTLVNQDWIGNDSWIGINEHTWETTDVKIEQLWNDSYASIYKLNKIILSVEAADFLTEEEKGMYSAQGKIMRAILYHYLYQYFGDVPLETSVNPSAILKRDQTLSIQDFLIEDLESAHSFFPNAATENLIFNRNSNYVARMRLEADKGTWTEVITFSTILSDAYGLVSDLDEVYYDAVSVETLISCPRGDNMEFNELFFGEYVPVMRYAEVLLYRAEAFARIGNLEGALERVNLLRARRGFPDLGPFGDLSTALEQIASLWRIEYYYEGSKYPAFKRLGALEDQLALPPFRFALPIPESVIATNPAMVQNPGY